MTWYEALLVTIATFAGMFAFIFAPWVLAGLFDRLVEGVRRKKYPEYFKYWDAAKAKSFENGAKFAACKKRFDYYMKLYTDGLRDGECTEEYYTEHMNRHMDEYKELCRWFQSASEEIKELLLKADLYAKEHNLLWGIIYDTKQKR